MKILNQKGISLIELLAAITISAIIIGGITALLFQTDQGFKKLTANENIQEKARIITEHIVNQVRAKSYTNITSTNADNNNSVLDLTVTATDKVVYRFTRPNFTIETTNGATTASMNITNQLDEATFTYDQVAGMLYIHLQFIDSTKPYNTSIRVPQWTH
jgi:prepilin-type N-terminal cleavage/methylation domain-containing protein